MHMGETLCAVSKTTYQKENILRSCKRSWKWLKWPSVRCNSLNDKDPQFHSSHWLHICSHLCSICRCLYVTWCSYGSLTKPFKDCLNQADVLLFSLQLTGGGMQSNPVQPALLWKLLDTLHWMETICEAPQRAQQWYFRERSQHNIAVDSYIYLGGHTDKNLEWSKKNLGPSMSARPCCCCFFTQWIPALTSTL